MILLVFVLFMPVLWHEQANTYDQAKAEFYRYLNRIQVEGRLSSADEDKMFEAFEVIGCPIEEIIACPRESAGDSRVLRSQDIAASTITVIVTCRPEGQDRLGALGKLVGAGQRDVEYTLEGAVLSERIDP